MEVGDWRTQLSADARRKIMNTFWDTLKRTVPWFGHGGLLELKKTAVEIEEKIYTSAISQIDYLEKISLEKQTLETMPAAKSVSSPEGSSDSTARSGNANDGDWQEELYQKIKALKDLYLLGFKDTYQKVLDRVQEHDSVPHQPTNELHEKRKAFNNKLERFIEFLETPKHNILVEHCEKLYSYEKEIIHIGDIVVARNAATQPPQPPLPPPHTQ